MGFINNFLKAIIDAIYQVVPNYGWAIVIFTVIVRSLLLPLDIKQKKEMRKMNDIQPKIQEINEKYKNDTDKKNQKTMELYKENKVNPFGGCLPLLIQMPILFAVFAVLRGVADVQVKAGAVESWLWVRNIWLPDVYWKNVQNGFFILPVLAGLTQYFQMQIMNTSGAAAQQQKGMNIFFPIFSTYICLTYNAAFSIYWVVANLYSMVEQFIWNLLSPNKVKPLKEGGKK